MILDAPTDENVEAYLRELLDFGVTDIVRTCEPTYNESTMTKAGVTVHEMVFGDGEAPPSEIIDSWLKLVSAVTAKRGAIAVHCVAGLGRAPVLVAVALIDSGMDPLDAVAYIRARRRGAINKRQLEYLTSYKKSKSSKCSCCIM